MSASWDDYFRCTKGHIINEDGSFTYECPLTRYNELQRKFVSNKPIRCQSDFNKFLDMLVSAEDFARLTNFYKGKLPYHLDEEDFVLGRVTYRDVIGSLEYFEGISHVGSVNVIDMGS